MNYICGGFQIRFGGEFRDYTELEQYVSGSGSTGFLIGEDASDFMAFYAVEVQKCFTNDMFRIGLILDNTRGAPKLCAIHDGSVLAIGMNNGVECVDLENRSVRDRIKLDSCVHHLLCNGDVLVAVHELGARALHLPDFAEMADVYCDVVADATLSATELVLISMEEETTRVDLASANQH